MAKDEGCVARMLRDIAARVKITPGPELRREIWKRMLAAWEESRRSMTTKEIREEGSGNKNVEGVQTAVVGVHRGVEWRPPQ